MSSLESLYETGNSTWERQRWWGRDKNLVFLVMEKREGQTMLAGHQENSHRRKVVERGGFEPPYPKDRIYNPTHLAALPSLHECRTSI